MQKVFNVIGSFLLNWVAVILFAVVHPFNAFAEILRTDNSSKQAFNNALSIDIFGNEYYETFWNWAFRKKNGYNFGVRNETISVAMAKNMRMGTLSWFGWICAFFINVADITRWFKGGHFKGLADKPRIV